MPEMDGYEAARTIRAMNTDTYFQKVPIIALTASAMGEVKQRVTDAGMNDFITKPFAPEELQAKILFNLNISHRERAPIKPEIKKGLGVDFDIYTEGDPDFKREFILLLLKNLDELKDALHETLSTGDMEAYSKAAHKVKTTVNILGDMEFARMIEFIKREIAEKGLPLGPSVVPEFTKLLETVKSGLEEEIRIL